MRDPHAIGAVHCHYVLSDWGSKAKQPQAIMDDFLDDVANEIDALIDNALQRGFHPVPDPNDSSPLQTIGAIKLEAGLNLLAAMAKIDVLTQYIARKTLLTEIQNLIIFEGAWKQHGTYIYKGDVHIDFTSEDIDSVLGVSMCDRPLTPLPLREGKMPSRPAV